MTTTFNPFFDTLLKEVFNSPIEDVVQGKSKYTHPSANIRSFADKFEIALAIPGLIKTDVNIAIVENQLVVNADKTTPEDTTYKNREFNYNKFSRKFNLPESADKTNIKAGMENGILSITIFKKKEEQPKTVEIA